MFFEDEDGQKTFDLAVEMFRFVYNRKLFGLSDYGAMAWYQDWFGEDYLKVYPHRDEAEARRQLDFVESILSLEGSERILDLGCGSGRHAMEMARRGYGVTCLDLSSVLLSMAQKKSDKGKCCTRFVKADMRYIPFSNAFDFVLSFFTTFGYFETDEENLQTLRSIAAALRSGGYVLLDYLNKTHVIQNIVTLDTRSGNGFEVVQERNYNKKHERIEKRITLKENGRVREYFESVRLYTLDEMKSLMADTDMKLRHCYGDFNGSQFTRESPRLILVGQRA